MKALVKYKKGIQGVELREISEPIPREGELKVKVLAASICGSDIHAIKDERQVNMPVVLGHEYVGQIVETCGNVGDFQIGDWVLTLPACYSCGNCELCQAGLVTLCRQRKSIGSHVNGAMAEYLVVPAKYSFHVPDIAKTLEEKIIYALTEPLACVVRGVYEKIDVKPGSTVVVSGPGVMGQFATQVFKTRGAYVILAGLPVDKEKLELGKKMGADEVVTSLEKLKEAVYRRSPDGAHITCDATGVVASLKNCMEVIRPLGTHLQIGMFGNEVPFRLDYMFDREVFYVPSNSTAVSSWNITLELLKTGKVDMRPFVSMKTTLSDWEEAFEAVIQRKVYKAILMP